MQADPGVPGEVVEERPPSAAAARETAAPGRHPEAVAAPQAVRRRGVRRWLPGELWTHGDFMKFWVGETASLFGNQVTMTALPIVAALTLGASARELGYLRTAEYAAFVALPLFVGVWVDRRRRRPIMLAANVARALLIGSIPVLAWLDALTLPYLYAVALASGVATVFFDVAWMSFLPSLVRREHLVEGNSKLMTSSSSAEVGGPGIAGLMIELVTAPAALLLDALSFVVSVVTLGLIKTREPEPRAATEARNVGAEILEGVRAVFGNAYLRALALEGAMFNAFFYFVMVAFIPYALRVLEWSPGIYGLLMSAAAVGAVLGTAIAPALARRFRFGPTLTAGLGLACVVTPLIPAAGGGGLGDKALVFFAMFAIGFGEGIGNVLGLTIRQTVTPDRLLGRMHASMRMMLYGSIPVGSLLGGFLGEAVGLRNAMWLACIGFGLAMVPIFRSPIPRLDDVPPAAEDDAAPAAHA
ncbi:MAG TPA: MFS transporter [Actinomycetota bacterium]|nr:MFS transporter [Actinomycetota bacterium]